MNEIYLTKLLFQQELKQETRRNEIITTTPGNRADYDMKIYIELPHMPWPPTMEMVGNLLRLKGMVEDRNYIWQKLIKGEIPAKGAIMLAEFMKECIFARHTPIRTLCKKYRMFE